MKPVRVAVLSMKVLRESFVFSFPLIVFIANKEWREREREKERNRVMQIDGKR